MVATRQTVRVVQSLLHYGPFAFCTQNKTVKVDLKTVGDGVVVDASRKPAGADECIRVETTAFSERTKLVWCVAGRLAATTADVQSELVRARRKATFQRAHHGSSDAG